MHVIIMSATLNVEKFSEYFLNCPVFHIHGRLFPVDIFYASQENQKNHRSNYVKYAIDTVMHIHVNDGPGDILVFLTGSITFIYLFLFSFLFSINFDF